MNYSKDKLMKETEDIAKDVFGPTFSFRPNQKEAIVDTIYNWLSGKNKHIIISAPTGSGKSIIALMCGAVLSKYYGKRGYVLCSDLGLLEQYRVDVENYFPNWAVLKGQQQYKCIINDQMFTAGACKLKGCKTYQEIARKFPQCAPDCPYLIERSKAIKSDVLVCTYAFWLIQLNNVAKSVENPPFDKRDFVICDEGHKLVGIVQEHYSPAFAEGDVTKMKNVIEAAAEQDADVIQNIEFCRQKIKHTEDLNELAEDINNYVGLLKIVDQAADTVTRCLDSEILSKEDRSLVFSAMFCKEHYSAFLDYLGVIKGAGPDVIVKNPSVDKPDNIKFNCINEYHLMGKYFHENCTMSMYMSATIGSPESYSRNHAIDKYEYISIPSTFEFNNSPIFYVPDYRLSYKEKEYSLPKIIDMVVATVRMYGGKRGIIQTGSYKFAQDVYDRVPSDVRKRLILYNNSTEKNESIEFFKNCKDKILVGPSLIEGLNFSDDLCRFQIIMKIPYPSLADKFVNRKKDISQKWYSDETAVSILQGVGRGIRHEKDWCVTFIFDGCFTYLAQSSWDMFPDEFKNRIQIIKPNSILGNG
jgi:Rad3-related DNA helicase